MGSATQIKDGILGTVSLVTNLLTVGAGASTTAGSVLTNDGSGNASWVVPSTANYGNTIFSNPGTYQWTAPPTVTQVKVYVWGAGGGGGMSDTGGGVAGGTGGGSGAFVYGTATVVPGNVYNIVVGSGGTGGSASRTANGATCGTSGTLSSFSSMVANGGGAGCASDYRSTGGTGGTGSGGTVLNGNNGIAHDDGGTSVNDSKGGSGGNSPYGGSGGPSGDFSTNDPTLLSGTAPGGGGGGVNDVQTASSANAGMGGSGQVTLYYSLPTN